MSATKVVTRPIETGRGTTLLFGGWEVGLLVIMAMLYLGGLYLNPAFFGSTGALFSVLRDASRYGVMAVGMTFVLVNKELAGDAFNRSASPEASPRKSVNCNQLTPDDAIASEQEQILAKLAERRRKE